MVKNEAAMAEVRWTLNIGSRSVETVIAKRSYEVGWPVVVTQS